MMLPQINTVDEIECEVGDLAHLLDATHAILHNLSREEMTNADTATVEQVHALVRIALDKAQHLCDEIGNNHRKIRGTDISAGNGDSIPDLFREWMASRDNRTEGKTEEELEERFQQYTALKDRMIAAEPRTPRDAALMFIADSDYGGSEISTACELRIYEIAGLKPE